MKDIRIIFSVIFSILIVGVGSGQFVFGEPGEGEFLNHDEGDRIRTFTLEPVEPDPNVGATFFGHGGYSADGAGVIGSGTLLAQVPPGSTVEQVYLYSTTLFTSTNTVTIDFDGTQYILDEMTHSTYNGCCNLKSFKHSSPDLVNQVKAKIGSGSDTPFSFPFTEVSPSTNDIDGVALVVIFSNPTFPENSIIISDGGLPTTSEQTIIGLGQPLDKTVDGFQATLSLGIGFSAQTNNLKECGGSQTSEIDINGQRLTSCAGGNDDGARANGELFTVGGVGDDTNNPPNPNGLGGEDDELYDISGFLNQGDTQIQIDTRNASNNDIIFLAIIQITARASVGEICGDGIDNDEDGLIDEGCAPPDRDGDGVPDTSDACPDEFAETENGCPLQCEEPEQISTLFDFNDGPPDEASGITTTESVRDYDQDGFDGDMLRNTSGGDPRGTPGEKTIITLTNLPEHDSVNISFLLAIIATWDGDTPCCEPDYFNVIVDGQEIFKETFAHPDKEASYNPPEGVLITLHENRGFHPWDQSYNMGNDPAFQNIPHTSDTLTVEFFADGAGWQGGGDESWGIDNLQITTNLSEPICEVPTPEEDDNDGGDNQWDTRPTFGVSHEDRTTQFVVDSFGYNGDYFTITDNWFTHFDKLPIEMGTMNTFEAKVYADKGLRIQEFLFSLPAVNEGHLAEVVVNVVYDTNQEIIDVIVEQETNVIDVETLTVSHEKSKCLPSSQEAKCDTTTISVMFQEELKHEVFALGAIDWKNRSQRSSFNDGFEITGQPINPMLTKMIPSNLKNEGLLKVTQVSKYSPYWTSEDGRMFEMNSFGSFKEINQSFERFQDTGDARTRLHSGFGGILQYEQNRAIQVFDSTKLISDLPDSFGYHFEITERLNEDIMQKIYEQQEIAKEILKEMDKQNRHY